MSPDEFEPCFQERADCMAAEIIDGEVYCLALCDTVFRRGRVCPFYRPVKGEEEKHE